MEGDVARNDKARRFKRVCVLRWGILATAGATQR